MIRVNPKNPKGIVWIASYPKSGNTWLRAFLVALYHLRSGEAPESIDINRMTEYVANDRAVTSFEKYLGRPPSDVDPSEIARSRPKVQEDIARNADGIVFVKTHNARINDRGVPMINQGVSAGALYIIRNPLDVAVSLADFRNVPVDQAIVDMGVPGFGLGTSINDVYFVSSSWSENVKSWTEPRSSAVHVVRYEDMLERTVGSFTQVANHVRLWPSRQQLEQAIELASFRNLQKAEREAGFKEKPDYARTSFFREGRAGQWRDVLTREQINRIVDAHGEQMARFGYLDGVR